MIEFRPAFGWNSVLLTLALAAAGSPALAQSATGTTTAEETAAPAIAVEPDPPAFWHVFKTTLGDFRRLPSRGTLTSLTIGGAVAIAGHTGDQGLTDSLSRMPGLGRALGAGRTFGSFPFQFGGAFATYAIGRLTKSSQGTRVGADLIRAQILAQSMSMAVKYSVRRTRPDGSNYSFPSGHASVTFASATALHKHFGWKAGVPAYGVASYVAASRIQGKRHYLSDVAFGAALGITAGRTVTVGRGGARCVVAPMAVAGGGGIAFTWIGKRYSGYL